ncbi:helix-turn-helix domain-containing protein [Leifsonia sp. fls2-241-R2A-40a]|uniref:GbsR/MarR family transcriptional regulator n=1 Tax=Leifsonia sp. fls2-241-R2A-40a TaxID=3040290 RepID=UPI00254B0B8B|nr:helix-turn-helix domain-containing protein [Leifsonia sp. fls2-241-R2A-40a]
MARDEATLAEVMEHSAAVLTAAGFPKMAARVLMALTVTESAGLTAAELAERLEVSPAAISGAVRYLQTLGIIRRLSQTGSRRDRYEIPSDWYALMVRNSPIYGVLADQAETGLAAVGDPASPATERLRDMAGFYRFVQGRLPELIAEWEQVRSARNA